jgi:hypothetical protein
MKPLQCLLAGMFALCFNYSTYAQDFEVPQMTLEKPEDYAKYEQDIIKAAKWLEATPIGQEKLKRALANKFILDWVEGSPTVTVQLLEFSGKLWNKNPDMLGLFVGAYARYALENNYDKDVVKSYTAATRSMINLYNLGGVKKNKTLLKAMEEEKAGNLENWIRENYMKK